MFEQPDGEAHRLFTKIATQTSTKIGTDFFHLLTKELYKELNADSVYIGEFTGGSADQVQTLALCEDGDLKRNYEFPLSGSPEAEVARGDPSIHLSDLQSKFPSDLRLSQLRAQACVELPLIDSEQRGPGVIGVFYRHSLGEVECARDLLAKWVPRVLAELNRKRLEDALRESEQRHRAFVELNRDPMWRIEFSEPIATDQPVDDQVESIIQKGRLAECNSALAHLLAAEQPEQLIGRTAFDILPESRHEAYREITERMVRSGYHHQTLEVERLDEFGQPRWFLRSHWGIVEKGKLRRIWGLHREITDLKECQSKLAISEKWLAELVETLHLAAIKLDSRGLLSYCNDYLLKLTGWKQEEIIGKKWIDNMVDPEDREKQRKLFSARTPVPIHFNGRLVCRDRRCRLVGWDCVVIRDPNGRIVSTVGACRDLMDDVDLETLPPRAKPLV